jgi:alkylation response protein AidB-like acyl-CoA dehydrogenase
VKFELTYEQEMLRATTGKLLSDAYPSIEAVNAAAQGNRGWREDVWASAAEVGVLGTTIAEEYGGLGAGPVELMAIMTEAGRRLAPEPFLAAAFLPAHLIGELGSAEQRSELLPSIAEGSLLVALAHEESGSRWPELSIGTKAAPSAAGWTVSGTKSVVAAGDVCQQLIVSASLGAEGVGLFLVNATVDGVERMPYTSYDRRGGARIAFADAAAVPLGEGGDATAALEVALMHAQAAECAEMIGVMGAGLDITVEYLKQRRQFGKTLSEFQALTHRAADLYVALELATSMSFYASAALAAGITDQVVASRAKFQVGRAARLIGQQVVQMHGGIGLTAEYAAGHYLTRLTALSRSVGSVEDHLRVLASSVSLDVDDD